MGSSGEGGPLKLLQLPGPEKSAAVDSDSAPFVKRNHKSNCDELGEEGPLLDTKDGGPLQAPKLLFVGDTIGSPPLAAEAFNTAICCCKGIFIGELSGRR